MRMIGLLFTLVSLMLVYPTSAQAENRLAQDEKLITGKLTNGMSYMIYPWRHPEKQVNLWLQVHAGSLQEEDDQRGVAHFVEHMLFNGTRVYPGNQVINTFEAMGLKFGKDINAYTSYNETVYQVSMPATNQHHLRTVMNIFKEWSSAATFTPEEVDAERGVITEEWRANHGLKWRNAHARRPFLFANSRYADREPIGLMDVVARVTPQRLRDFYQRWYQPENMTFIVLGDVDEKTALTLIEQSLGTLPAGKSGEKVVLPAVAEKKIRFNIINDAENRVNSIALYYRIPAIHVTTESRFLQQSELSMLIQLFNQRMQERMHAGELDDIAGSTARSIRFSRDYQAVLFQVNARGDNMQRAAEVLISELARIDRDGFSQAELRQLKATRLAWLKNSVAQSNERNAGMLTARLAHSALNDTPFISVQENYRLAQQLWDAITVQSITERWQALRATEDAFWEQMVNSDSTQKQALTDRDIRQLQTHYSGAALSAYILPDKTLTLADSWESAGEITEKQQLADGLTQLTLGNGAQVLLVNPASDETKVQLVALVNKGYLSVPARQKALLALANNAVSGSGVGRMTASELKRWSAEQAATVSSRVASRYAQITVNMTQANPEPGFQLVNQRITHSRINHPVWETLRNLHKQSIAILNQRPADRFAQTIYQASYSDHRTQLPSAQQIDSVSAADALAMDRRLFADPRQITFVITSNMDEQQLTPLIARYLASIRPGDNAPLADNLPLSRVKENKYIILHEQREPVAQLIDLKRFTLQQPVSSKDRMELEAFNFVLAKDLRVKLREQASGVYGVSSRISIDPQVNDISYRIAFSCQPARYQELHTLANSVFDARLKKGVSDTELDEYRAVTLRTLRIQRHNVQQLANRVINSLIQDHSPIGWMEQESIVQNMSAEEVNRTSQAYFATPLNTVSGVLLPRSVTP